jgi:D-sedoheptulose 7-phosphate isomerase
MYESKAIEELRARLPVLSPLCPELYRALRMLEDCVRAGQKILLCGNGGSAADADHIAGELMKSFAYRRPLGPELQARFTSEFPTAAPGLIAALETPIPAIALAGQVATQTAFSNDVDYRYAFAQQVLGLGATGDVLIALSTSGNSLNILHACMVARVRGLEVIGLTGASGGKLRELCNVTLCAPATETHLVQELHLPLYHALCLALEERLFGQHGRRT